MEDFNIYIMATGVSQDQQKKALLLNLAGKEVKEIYKTVKKIMIIMKNFVKS